MYDIIIIGGGPAGFTAALYTARAGLNTLLIEKLFSGGQMATTYLIENYPGIDESIGGTDLALRMENQARKLGAQIVNEDVIDLTLDKVVKTVKTNKGIYQGKAVILCMGASPRELGHPKEKLLRGSGVSYCATCDGAFYKDRAVAIVGGGDTAAEDALYLARFCPKVYIVHRRDSMRASKVLQDELLNNEKVEFIWSSVIDDILGDFGVEGIKVKNLKNGEIRQIAVDGLFVAIGTIPNSDLVKGKLELNQSGYIVTDNNMQTNLFGVFAAVDVREKVLRQVITAASDGAIAAYMAERYINENRW